MSFLANGRLPSVPLLPRRGCVLSCAALQPWRAIGLFRGFSTRTSDRDVGRLRNTLDSFTLKQNWLTFTTLVSLKAQSSSP